MELLESIIRFLSSYPPWARLLAIVGVSVTLVTLIFAPREALVAGTAKSGFKIDSPIADSTVPLSFPVTGTFKNLPKGFELWIITTSASQERYWPQERAAPRKEDKTWSGHVSGIGKPGEKRTFGLFLVGPDGQVLIDLWKSARRVSANSNEPALRELTNDTYLVDELTVFVEPGKP